LHEAAHGFRSARSIVSNAIPHLGANILINLDLKNFFPTICYKRVKGVFRAFGYSEAISVIFALFCTEAEVQEVEMDGKTYFVSLSDRHLPQGAPTSPCLTNIICRRMDKRLSKLARNANCDYSRYADDLSFSSPSGELNVGQLLRRIHYVVETENFVVHPDKTRVMRKSRLQEVTGIVVNEKTNISNKVLKRFRALLYQIEKDGPEGKVWGSSSDILLSIQGFANYVAMVNPEKGALFKDKIKVIIDKYYN
ncbi:MAG: reverse transcriptase family protein, partial [Spirochaetota bacterium]|nr:reverse transcriptase family protein [Spirochaetota bacterium]